MKRILFILAAIMLVSACNATLPGRITRLANKVESKGANFSTSQWEKTNAKFQKLLDEYIDNYSDFTASQKKEINKALLKYGKAALKAGFTNVTSIISSALEGLPSTLEELREGARGLFEGW